MTTATLALIFAAVFVIAIASLIIAGRQQSRLQKKKIVDTLRGADASPAAETTLLIDGRGDKSPLARFLARFNVIQRLEIQLRQAGMETAPATVCIQSLIAAVPGALLGLRYPVLLTPAITAITCAVASGSVPYLYVKRKRSRRLAAFEEQFPEALDFLGRAMRAGHAFSIALEMLAQESEEPIATEFRRTAHEHNLGMPIDAALGGLSDRVPLIDVQFFVSAVLLQRETGGNLAEILNGLALVIRERFKLKGQIRSASAHARLTASVLTFMPIFAALAFSVISPGYLTTLGAHPVGKVLLAGAVVAQVLGHLTIRKLLQIRV